MRRVDDSVRRRSFAIQSEKVSDGDKKKKSKKKRKRMALGIRDVGALRWLNSSNHVVGQQRARDR